MNRTKLTFFNISGSFVYQITLLITGIIVPKVILNIYGSEINGLISSIIQFVSYFTLIEAGLSGASIFALYKPLSNNNYDEINVIITTTKVQYKRISYIFILLVLLLSIVYPFFIKVTTLKIYEVRILVLILSVSSLIEFISLSKYRALLTADQKSYIISLTTALYSIVNMIIIITLSYYNFSIIIVRLVAIISILLRVYLLKKITLKKYSFLNYKYKIDYSKISKRWDVLFLQILISIQQGTPLVLATFFLDIKLVSVYAVYMIVMNGINGVLGMSSQGLASAYGNLYSLGEIDKLRNAHKQFEFLYYYFMIFLYSITYIMYKPFISLYTQGITDVNYIDSILPLLIIFSSLLYNLQTPNGIMVIGTGKFRETRYQSLLQAILQVVFSIIFVYFYGLYGIIYGAIISNIYRTIDLLIFTNHFILTQSIKSSTIRIFKLLILFAIIITFFNFIPYDISNYFEWVIWATIYSVISLLIILFYLFLFEKDLLVASKNRVSVLLNSLMKR